MGMVVRSNIMAVNAQRQLGMNNSQVGKSLEKLSSGFRINRAGDDASGLAISEKMKAQIRGLETASSNSQDGISLIQTAEGALTEVHDMLNRMVEIAGKAANGTMDDDTDRAALQKEVDALKSEINRIAEGTNFNGINLLDGSMGSAATITNVAGKDVSYSTTGTLPAEVTGVDLAASGLNDGTTMKVKVETVTAANSQGTTAVLGGITFDIKSGANSSALNGKTIKVVIGQTGDTTNKAEDDGNGTITVTLKGDDVANDYGTSGAKGTAAASAIQAALRSLNGDYANVTVTASATDFTSAVTNGNSANASMAGGADGTDKKVTVTADGDTFEYTGKLAAGGQAVTLKKNGGTETIDLTLASNNDVAEKDLATVKKENATAAKTTIDFKGKTGKDVFGATVTVGDKTYEFVKAGETAKTKGATAIEVGEADTADAIATALEQHIAADLVAGGTHNANVNGSAIEIEDTTVGVNGTFVDVDQQGAGLELQIGDTADSFNKLGVVIKDMSTKGLEIEDLSVLKKDDASKALDAIKKGADSAINRVSAARADLGAAQNRLEHTINNLDVATENMTSANSRIRDTDMAKQMMDYTKMNVLTQAAQAMLAQANQQPQSVLQLLQ